jgi:hypothetical protein
MTNTVKIVGNTKKTPIMRYAAIAACLVFAVGVALLLYMPKPASAPDMDAGGMAQAPELAEVAVESDEASQDDGYYANDSEAQLLDEYSASDTAYVGAPQAAPSQTPNAPSPPAFTAARTAHHRAKLSRRPVPDE